MVLKLALAKLDGFHLSKDLTVETCSLTADLPKKEKYSLTRQTN